MGLELAVWGAGCLLPAAGEREGSSVRADGAELIDKVDCAAAHLSRSSAL